MTHDDTSPTALTPSRSGEGDDVFVVAIGASAGGLESLERLFSALPPDTGMAFIVL